MLKYLRKVYSTLDNAALVAQLEATSTNVAGSTRGAGLVAEPAGTWVYHYPAAATKATKVQDAPASGSRLIITAIKALTECGATGIVIADGLTLKMIKDAAGSPVVLDEMPWSAAANDKFGIVMPCRILVPEATSFTLEFSAAGPTNSRQYVGFSYITAPA